MLTYGPSQAGHDLCNDYVPFLCRQLAMQNQSVQSAGLVPTDAHMRCCHEECMWTC